MNEKIKKGLKVGKTFTIIIIIVFCIIGIVLLFLDTPLERMQAYKMLIDSVYPIILPISGGVSIGGIIKKILPNGIKKE